MIRLTKLNREPFLLNHMQIETIEMIPETKIIMMNHDYYIVRETPEAVVKAGRTGDTGQSINQRKSLH